MDLRAQPLLQSSAADRLLFARDLCAHRTTLVSGSRHPFPIPASSTRHYCRFSRRSRSARNLEVPFQNSYLGFGPLRAEPGVADGIGVSREHGSYHGVANGLRGVDVPSKSAKTGGTVLCAELSD